MKIKNGLELWSNGQCVAEVKKLPGGEALAQTLAVVPEMLGALKLMRKMLSSADDHDVSKRLKALEAIDAAIVKAEGKKE